MAARRVTPHLGSHGGTDAEMPLRQLRWESRNIQTLLAAYIADLDLISGDPPAGALLYFIDAHDLKAYIEPDNDEFLSGFILDAERLQVGEQLLELMREMRWLSDTLLGELLFNPDRQVVLLPSHAEEIDEKIAHHNRERMRREISLLPKARAEAEALREELRRQLSAIAHDPTNRALKESALDHIRTNAPALMAMLGREPGSPQARIDELVERSNLVSSPLIDWTRFGFDAEACERLRGFRFDTTLVEPWQRYLRERPERRNNSYRANQIDAEAIAYVQQLNGLLAEIDGPRVEARFVTRAMTLVSALRERKTLERAGLPPVDFLRHPRLVALDPRPVEPSLAGSQPNDDPGVEARLVVALQTYSKRLQLALEGSDAPMVLTQERTEIDQAALLRSAESMVATWKEFETWRVARAQHVPRSADDGAVDELRRFFGDTDVIRLIHQHLSDSVERFGKAVFSIGVAAIPEEVPLLIAPSGRKQVYVLPAIGESPGPVAFARSALPETVPAFTTEGHVILSARLTGAAERYLGGALLLACSRRWNLAGIYADSAVHIAKLLPVGSQEMADEARLLRAAIRRLGGSLTAKTGEARSIDPSLRRMQRRSGDPRLALEIAVEILELNLAGKAQGNPELSLTEGAKELDVALSHPRQNPLVTLQVLTISLVFHLVLRAEAPDWRDNVDVDAEARTRHQTLRTLLMEHRSRSHAVPPLASAVEILGFQLIAPKPSQDAAEHIAGRLTSRNPDRVPLRVPSDIRLDSRDVLNALSPAQDHITRRVREELKPIVDRIERQRRRDLIYAPIWASYATDAILELQPAPLRPGVDAALKILARVSGVSQQVGVGVEERGALTEARDMLAEAARRLRSINSDEPAASDRQRRALFYVEMEQCYAKLLLILISREHERQQLRLELADHYRSIIAEYPNASIPYFRLHITLNDYDSQVRPKEPGVLQPYSPEVRATLDEALRHLADDPYLTDPNHWVRSTIHRRHMYSLFVEAEKAYAEWRRDKSKTGLRDQAECQMAAAFRQAMDGFSLDLAKVDFLHWLETTRRANNILFYASRFLVEHAAPDGFERLGTSPDELYRLIAFLCPDGMDALSDVALVHTLGYAYFALGDSEQAAVAGKCLLVLILESGDDLHDPQTAALLNDAFKWVRDDRQTVQLQPTHSLPVPALAAS